MTSSVRRDRRGCRARRARCWRLACPSDPDRRCCCSRPARTIASADAPAGRAVAELPRVPSANPGGSGPSLARDPCARVRPQSLYVRGRGAGGSSSVNAMCAIRGIPDDYRRWARGARVPGLGLDRDARRLPARSRTTSTTVATVSTAWAARSRCRAGPSASSAPLDRARARRDGRSRVPDVRRLPRRRRHRREPRRAHRARRTAGVDERRLPGARTDACRISRCAATSSSTASLLDGTARRRRADRRRRGDRRGARCSSRAGAIHSPAILLRSGIGRRRRPPGRSEPAEHAATPGLRDRAAARRAHASPDAPVLSSMLRYGSGLAAAGPNDMQILWFDAVGPDVDGLADGRLIGAVMRVFSHGGCRLRSDDPPRRSRRRLRASCPTTAIASGCATASGA